ncbi:hypothetical protein EDC18_1071 [Natranaerovirga pectinivora]|uniref:Lipoprotein n=1 Tax=Natranaerovirga pectinivora TaxID=682400 RepID=A0A4R3MIV4_9FIRM|nr:hypothetical protein [Natranaerovirga pectinivora]TCT13933.1 hypothetical protein EDC18_1071 [Natranaerovirga pectinivora]
MKKILALLVICTLAFSACRAGALEDGTQNDQPNFPNTTGLQDPYEDTTIEEADNDIDVALDHPELRRINATLTTQLEDLDAAASDPSINYTDRARIYTDRANAYGTALNEFNALGLNDQANAPHYDNIRNYYQTGHTRFNEFGTNYAGFQTQADEQNFLGRMGEDGRYINANIEDAYRNSMRQLGLVE